MVENTYKYVRVIEAEVKEPIIFAPLYVWTLIESK